MMPITSIIVDKRPVFFRQNGEILQNDNIDELNKCNYSEMEREREGRETMRKAEERRTEVGSR